MTGIIRQAITDTDGIVDVSYLALFWVLVSVLGAITFACVMSAVSYWRCTPTPTQIVGAVVVPATTCAFDPQPLGIAVGAICGGFATALGALAGYMLATRRTQAPIQPQGERNEPCR